MKLVVGLGNPGTKYQGTRHNIGFELVDRLARGGRGASFARKFEAQIAEVEIDYRRVLLLKPETFMNLSGRSVGQAVRFYKLEPAGSPGRLRRPEPARGQDPDPTGRLRRRAEGAPRHHRPPGHRPVSPAPDRHRRPGPGSTPPTLCSALPQPRTSPDRRHPDPRHPGRRRLGDPGNRRGHEPVQRTRA